MALTAVGQQHVLATLFGPFPSCSASPSGLHIPRGRPTHLRTNSHCATFPPSLMDLNLVITVCFMRGPLFHKYNVSHYFRSQFIARRILQSLPFFWDPLHTSSFVSHLQMVGPFSLLLPSCLRSHRGFRSPSFRPKKRKEKNEEGRRYG